MGKISLLQSLFLFIATFFIHIDKVSSHGIPDLDHYRFIENKGQWEDFIKFKASIPGGALFVEKGGLTYNFFDNSILRRNHDSNRNSSPDTLLKFHAIKIKFVGANPDTDCEGEGAFEDYYNYYLGNDQTKWASHVSSFRKINLNQLYKGINLDIYSKQDHLKYDFVLQPGIDFKQIQMLYEGADSLFIRNGQLVIKTSLGELIEKKPYCYQFIGGKIVKVLCQFKISGKNLITFDFPKGYNNSYELVIDPELIFSTYSGSTADNFGYTATFDSEGFLYSAGSVFSFGYPVTDGAFQISIMGGDTAYYPNRIIMTTGTDIGITKYDTSGTKRIYSTYLGGFGSELPHSLIVNNNDQLLLYGTTSSVNFPLKNPIYNRFKGGSSIFFMGLSVFFRNGTDMFVTKFNASGNALLASTLLGGTKNDGLNVMADSLRYTNIFSPLSYNYADEVRGEIEIDPDNNVYIVSSTNSDDFPMVGSTFQPKFGNGNLDGVIIKLDSSLENILWSSYLGGGGSDAAYSVTINTQKEIYITGGTTSENFPTSDSGVYQSYNGGRSDGYITHVSSDGSKILHSTFIGHTSYDQSYFVELDNHQNVYVFGQCENPGTALIKNALYNQPNSGQFITKLNPSLDTIHWSTTFGTGDGFPNISPTAFMVDLCNKIYLSGWGGETQLSAQFYDPATNDIYYSNNAGTNAGLEITDDAFQSTTDSSDFYLMVLEDDASKIVYGSYFGGNKSHEHVDGGTSRFDRKGKMYQSVCAGCGSNDDFPIFPPNAVSSTNKSRNCNNGVFKFDFRMPTVVADFKFNGCNPIQFTNTSLKQKATTYLWDFGDSSTSTEENPVHVYSKSGTYKVKLKVEDKKTCNLGDSIVKEVYISPLYEGVTATATPDLVYLNSKKNTSQLEALPNGEYNYFWNPTESLSDAQIPNPIATPKDTTTYYVEAVDKGNQCRYGDSVTVYVKEVLCNESNIYIPNAFTPNEDFKNDLYKIRGKDIELFHLSIFDRWGEKVFETQDVEEGWDGIYKNKQVDPGVFVYYLEVTCVNEETYFKKGNITLIR